MMMTRWAFIVMPAVQGVPTRCQQHKVINLKIVSCSELPNAKKIMSAWLCYMFKQNQCAHETAGTHPKTAALWTPVLGWHLIRTTCHVKV
eukprot:4457848-Amphidinium_carterae.1